MTFGDDKNYIEAWGNGDVCSIDAHTDSGKFDELFKELVQWAKDNKFQKIQMVSQHPTKVVQRWGRRKGFDVKYTTLEYVL